MSRPGSQVHLYAQVWNEATLLPAFFRHYDPVVTHYTIFDDGSDDGTLEILAAHPRVAVLSFPRSDPESFVASEQVLSNRCWKDSRGQADWVIVTDVDEFLVHPDLPGYLTRAHAAGVTAVPALGFQLISETTWPADRSPVDVETGAAWAQMLKISVFDPDAITDIGTVPAGTRPIPSARWCCPSATSWPCSTRSSSVGPSPSPANTAWDDGSGTGTGPRAGEWSTSSPDRGSMPSSIGCWLGPVNSGPGGRATTIR